MHIIIYTTHVFRWSHFRNYLKPVLVVLQPAFTTFFVIRSTHHWVYHCGAWNSESYRCRVAGSGWASGIRSTTGAEICDCAINMYILAYIIIYIYAKIYIYICTYIYILLRYRKIPTIHWLNHHSSPESFASLLQRCWITMARWHSQHRWSPKYQINPDICPGSLVIKPFIYSNLRWCRWCPPLINVFFCHG